jgi:NAD(P)-dependent dehydrogenase (short-subunit alcohol dehydrogenase family)
VTEAQQKFRDTIADDGLADRILCITADVTDEADVARRVQETVAHFGGLDVAFSCAGMSYSSTSILETDIYLWDKVLKVNPQPGNSHSLIVRSVSGWRNSRKCMNY